MEFDLDDLVDLVIAVFFWFVVGFFIVGAANAISLFFLNMKTPDWLAVIVAVIYMFLFYKSKNRIITQEYRIVEDLQTKEIIKIKGGRNIIGVDLKLWLLLIFFILFAIGALK